MAGFLIDAQLRGYLNQLKGPQFEKNIPHMYVDTTGNVTVGVGHNITSHGDYQSLAFVVKRTGRKAVLGGDKGLPIGMPQTIGRIATTAEKKNDYDFLRKHTGLGNYAPEHLAAYTTLEMNQPEIDRLFEKDLQDAIAVARNTFGGITFDNYPVSCQAALIDIAFNCGSFSTFHTLLHAVRGTGIYTGKPWSERWKTAAATYSNRGQVNAARNSTIQRWLNAGAA
jgi:GH24 family phage-related lysozyme (muramidase)